MNTLSPNFHNPLVPQPKRTYSVTYTVVTDNIIALADINELHEFLINNSNTTIIVNECPDAVIAE